MSSAKTIRTERRGETRLDLRPEAVAVGRGSSSSHSGALPEGVTDWE
jgi:hypothetical protein